MKVEDKFGNSLLICSAQNGHLAIAKILVERGCEITKQNGKGNTALHYAFAYNHLDVLTFLIEHEPDAAFLVNDKGNSCYDGL